MEEYGEHIIILLKQYLDGACDEEAYRELQKWLSASEQNQELFERIRKKEVLVEKWAFYHHTDKEEDWKKICLRTSLKKTSGRYRYWLRYAAVIAFLLGVAGWYKWQNSEVQPLLPLTQGKVDSVRPGYRHAYLQSAEGEWIRLGDTLNRIRKRIKGGELKEGKEGLVLLADDSVRVDPEIANYYTLTVPRGGEYQLTLADGTKVWINSDSELEFPSVFACEKRVVRLKGEAYFEVKADKKHPFVVEMEKTRVAVLGTSFNINAYGGKINTSLVEGLVSIQTEKGDFQLTPGYQAVVADDEVVVQKVDVYEQMAWKEGKFIFKRKRLEEVMTILARWYDLEVLYQDEEVKDMHFTGNIPRHVSIGEVLKFLEHTRLVHFNIHKHRVMVTR